MTGYEDNSGVGDSVLDEVTHPVPEPDEPIELVPVRGTGWRGYEVWRCPVCPYERTQNPRKRPAHDDVAEHIARAH